MNAFTLIFLVLIIGIILLVVGFMKKKRSLIITALAIFAMFFIWIILLGHALKNM